MNDPGLPPELAGYLDEPKQLRVGSMGKEAFLHLRFERRGPRSILALMDRRAPLLVQRALYCDEGMPEIPVVSIISNAGGILQGDRYTLKLEVAEDAFAHVTTQAMTKIHEMDANYASQAQEILLERGAYFEYIPDAAIPFKHSRFLTRTRIVIDPTATLLYSEILMGGRKYYGDGELFLFDLYSSTVRAERPDGAELFTERFVISPGIDDIRAPGAMGEFDVFGNVVLLTPGHHADRIFDRVAATYDREARCASGVGRLPNGAGLIYKVLGMESGDVRAKVREFWGLVRQEVKGFPAPKEAPWH